MATPRVKRPFAGAASDPAQRQITSFFNPQKPGEPHSYIPEAHQWPVPPAPVQSNLLSVGMRIRKSVPEGYKTNTTSAFKLWTDTSKGPAPTSRPSATRVSSRELLPFCGLNKVGGHDTQSSFRFEADDVPDLDDLPELTMSQESTDSTASSNGRKRNLLEDEEDETDPVISWLSDDDGHGLSQNNARVLAMPRRRGMKRAGVGQENMFADEDFEEADFLMQD